jgi:hypothetical protein
MKYTLISWILLTQVLFISLAYSNPTQSNIDSILEEMLVDKPTKEIFKTYHKLYNKEYGINTEEAIQRYRAFKKNLAEIREVNSKNLSYKFGFGPFTDISKEEFKQKVLSKPFEEEFDPNFAQTPYETGQTQVNWLNYLRPAVSQEACGSCWAFASITALEGNYKIAYGKEIALSQQELIDCDLKNKGCNGGSAPNSFGYIQTNGVAFLSEYPYTSTKSTCRSNSTKRNKVVSRHETCTRCNLQSWMSILAKGPIYTTMISDNIGLYKSGILEDICPGYKGANNHGVVVVGISNDNDGKGDYLIVRNSWGQAWGEQGNYRIRIDNNFTCGHTMRATRPVPRKATEVIPPSPAPRCAKFYNLCDFKGTLLEFCESNTNVSGVASSSTYGDITDNFSLFTDINCVGQQFHSFAQSQCYPTPFNFKSVLIVSIDVPANGCVFLYDGYCHTGNKIEVCTNIPDLNTIGWANRISSIKIDSKVSIELFEAISYTNPWIRFRFFSNSSLFKLGIDKMAKSLKIDSY